MSSNGELDGLFRNAETGSAAARDQLFAALYSELHRIARRELGRQSPHVATLSATTLLHEVYEELAGRPDLAFPDRGRFMAYVSRVMRGFIIDRVRERLSQKRGGEFHFTQIDTEISEGVAAAPDLQRLSDALDELARKDAALAEVVDLKFFCGLTLGEIAVLRNVSERTLQRDWEKARLLLFNSMNSLE
jgi:RNA polymerase sigma factor (TIGR02999 family)